MRFIYDHSENMSGIPEYENYIIKLRNTQRRKLFEWTSILREIMFVSSILNQRRILTRKRKQERIQKKEKIKSWGRESEKKEKYYD